MRLLFRILTFPIRLIWRFTTPAISGSFWVTNPLAIDGDTIWTDGERIRIWGIDAPEMSEPDGEAAKRQLAQLCRNRRIYVVPVDVDTYGRKVARLFYGRGDIGQAMVASGYAISARNAYPRDLARAKKARAGLWSRGGISDPAQHRAQKQASRRAA